MNNPSIRGKGFAILIVSLIFVVSNVANAKFRRPDLEQVPVSDLIANLKKKVEADPENSELRMNLARVYAMAFSQKVEKLQVLKGKPEEAWFGYVPIHVPFSYVKNSSDEKVNEAAKKSLKEAVTHFRKAVELDSENLTAKLSLAWCLDQMGEDMEANESYREIVKVAWEKEKEMTRAGLRWRSVVAEAAGYLIANLDQQKNADEIKALEEKVKVVSKIPRPITPIAIGTRASMGIEEIIDRENSVGFDVDGSNIGRNWTWISQDAAWLVYDRKGNGKIRSGLQLFGNVTFWCFWENGYQAMGSLDSNQDGKLSDDELKHLALWQDKNGNGVSDKGEVKSLREWGIVEISCQCEKIPAKPNSDQINAVAFSKAGVKFADGSTRATYDIVLHQK